MSRPEHLMPPECYYNEDEAKRYTNCSRIIDVQAAMAQKCVELLDLPEGPLTVLDLGCGSGLSARVIEEEGHFCWGLDISPDMLNVSKTQNSESEVMLTDLGQGFNFSNGFFDAAISVSAIQWLCNADKKAHNPWKRLLRFFESLQRALKSTGKAALQFYPENAQQIEMICNAAIKAGFAGGLYIDYPNSAAAKKYYLVLQNAIEGKLGIILQQSGEEAHNVLVAQEGTRRKIKKSEKKGKFATKSKFWIYEKKDKQRKQGTKVRKDTKYTGRKRRVYF